MLKLKSSFSVPQIPGGQETQEADKKLLINSKNLKNSFSNARSFFSMKIIEKDKIQKISYIVLDKFKEVFELIEGIVDNSDKELDDYLNAAKGSSNHELIQLLSDFINEYSDDGIERQKGLQQKKIDSQKATEARMTAENKERLEDAWQADKLRNLI